MFQTERRTEDVKVKLTKAPATFTNQDLQDSKRDAGSLAPQFPTHPTPVQPEKTARDPKDPHKDDGSMP